jgi:hypothetical protein
MARSLRIKFSLEFREACCSSAYILNLARWLSVACDIEGQGALWSLDRGHGAEGT